MDTKKIITIVLMVFLVGSAAFMIFGGLSPKNDGDSEIPGVSGENSEKVNPGHHVEVYYFFTTKRCPTCLKIERYTRESIEAAFPRLLDSGELKFFMLNVEEKENEHFIEDYQLTTKSVVLVDYRDGERIDWKNLEKVWEYTGNREIFVDYIRDETRAFLAELYEAE